MTTRQLFVSLFLAACPLAGCGGGGGGGEEPGPGSATVAGTMRFVLGGTSNASASTAARGQTGVDGVSSELLVAADGYIVSPRRAKITFTEVVFRGASGEALGTSSLGNSTVTYDRSLSSGSTLLDLPVTAPVGNVYQIAVYFDKTILLLVSDPTAGIYSNSSSATGYSTSAPVGGADFVPLTITGPDPSPSTALPIIFPSPVSIAAGSAPNLYITIDMLQSLQLTVDTGGNTLSPGTGNQPVSLFGGLTPGTSRYYSNSNTIESYKVGSVANYHSLLIFYDQAGVPLYLFSPLVCGAAGPRGAWATPPVGATIGGWLGKDGTGVLAWALPTTTSYVSYSAYYVMPEQTVLGQNTTLSCKATATPPAPQDGNTYASGAPLMPNPNVVTSLKLLAR